MTKRYFTSKMKEDSNIHFRKAMDLYWRINHRQMEPSQKPKGGVIHFGVGASYTRINTTRRMCHIRRNLVKDFPILNLRRR